MAHGSAARTDGPKTIYLKQGLKMMRKLTLVTLLLASTAQAESVKIDWCTDLTQFNSGKPFEIDKAYADRCEAKTPRLKLTQATDAAKHYFKCRCAFQGKIWTEFDP